MGFEIGKNVQSGDVTYQQLKEKLGDKFDESKLKSIFNQFNTNQTANDKNEQVLDQNEQIAMMSFFKEIAGGKKGDAKDTKISRSDLRSYKKANKNSDMSFVQNLGYKDMKKIMQAFTGVVEADDSDNMEIQSYEQTKGDVSSVTIDGKKYTIDKDNHLTDADGVKYEYKDGKLSKITDDNTTTTFDNGVKRQETVKGENGTTTTTYQADGRTLKQTVVGDKTNQTTTTTNYSEKGVRTNDSVVDNKNNRTTTNTYRPDGNTISQTVVDDRAKNTKTTTTFNTDGKTKLREVEVDTSNSEVPKTTTTTFNTQGSYAKRVITSGKGNNTSTTTINYSNRSITTSNGNIETVRSFTKHDAKTGNVDNADVTKTVKTDKSKHTRTTTTASEPHIRTIELLDDNNKTVTRTVKFDSKAKTATYTADGKTVTLQTDSNGNIIANGKFNNTRMETVGEAAIRMGFAKGSEAYNTIVKQNGGADTRIKVGGSIKVPQEYTISKDFSAQNTNVDATAERKKWANYQVQYRESNRSEYSQKAFEKYNNDNPNAKLRKTWASGSLQVYCEEKVQNGYNQHKIYDAASNSLVNLETYLNLSDGQYVDRITEDGHARVQPGNKLVKINIKTKTTTNASTSDYNNSFTNSVKKGYTGDIDGTVNKDAHKYVYQGNTRTDVTNDKQEVLVNGKWTTKPTTQAEENALNKATQLGYNGTKNPLVFNMGSQYYYYNAENDKFEQLNGISSINDDGTIKLPDGKDYKIEDIILGDKLFIDARDNNGGTSVKAMNTHMTSSGGITADNVVEVYNAYKARSYNLGINESIVNTMTNEWLGYTKGHGRDYALQNTKHIIQKLVDRAEKEGVTGECINKANEFIKDNIWAETYITSHGLNDDALDDKAEPIIDALINAIENASAPENEEVVEEEVIEEEV